jgi:hypothetical protein
MAKNVATENGEEVHPNVTAGKTGYIGPHQERGVIDPDSGKQQQEGPQSLARTCEI